MSWARGCRGLYWGLYRRRVWHFDREASLVVHSCSRWAGGRRSGRVLFEHLEEVLPPQ